MTAVPALNGLDLIEVVSGAVFGTDTSSPEPPVTTSLSPGDALVQALLPFLHLSPCGVTFSGGRDSSAVLATATNVARRHGLADPLPVTLRFPTAELTDERRFQESVVRHLGLREWTILEPGDSLDVLGEVATGLTRRHGLLYPGNIHFLVPMLEAVSGGGLLTGLGGDEVLGGHQNHALAAMVLGRRRPSRRLIRQLAKRYVVRSRARDQTRAALASSFEWLVPEVRRDVIERFVDASTSDSLFADRELISGTFRLRYLERARAHLAVVADDLGVTIAHPLLDAGFVGALAGRVGRVGYASRTETMTHLFGGLLPGDVVRRTSKAQFNDIFWTRHARALAETLPVDPLADLVVESPLRDLWSSDRPKGNTYLLAKYLRVAAEGP